MNSHNLFHRLYPDSGFLRTESIFWVQVVDHIGHDPMEGEESWTKSDLEVRRSITRKVYESYSMIFVVLLTRRVSDFHFRIQSLSSFSCCLEVLSGCDKVFKENLTYWWTLVQYCPSFSKHEILYSFGMGSV